MIVKKNLVCTGFVTVILIIIIILFSGNGSVLGQAITNKFATYDNPNFGIRIQYPTNWAKEETNDEFSKDIMFLVLGSPIKYGEKLSVAIFDARAGKSLDSIINNLINFNKHENTLGNYQVIESVPIVVNGINAHKLVTTFSDSKFGNVKSMQVLMLKGGKEYEILYTSDPAKYEVLLPTIQKMIDSFQITK